MPVQVTKGLLCAGAPVPESLSQSPVPDGTWVPGPLSSVCLPCFSLGTSFLPAPGTFPHFKFVSFGSRNSFLCFLQRPPCPQAPCFPPTLFWQIRVCLIHSPTKQTPDAYSVLGTAPASETQKTMSLSPWSFLPSVNTQTPNKQTHKGEAYSSLPV